MIKKILATFCFILFTLTSKASLILETDNNSYIDSLTNIEWMDFGINKGQSFDYVSSQLSVGGEYENWRLPTTDEVYAMWSHVANLDNVEADYERANRYGTGQLYAHDLNNNQNTESVFDDVFKIMGYNELNPYGSGQSLKVWGFFNGTDGLSYVGYSNYTLHRGVRDSLLLNDNVNYSQYSAEEREKWSTLLVRSSFDAATPVPEPSTILMFLTALFSYLWIKLISKNNIHAA